MIKSVYENQSDILRSIMTLNQIDRFCVDATYGNGSFYKDIIDPVHKFDIHPQCEGVTQASSCSLPLKKQSVESFVFDPPFLTYIKAAREHNSIMAKRFGGYWRYDELEDHYRKTIAEAYRVLSSKGIMVFKCQDIIHNHKLHLTHVNVVKWSEGFFRVKDMFILPAKNRMPMPSKKGEKKRVQKHARIHHSYFLVLEKLT